MLTNNEISQLVDKIVVHYKPDKVMLLGSYANNTATENSDLDLLIIKNTELEPHKRNSELYKLLKGVLFPLDILIYTRSEYEAFSHQKHTFLNHALKTSKTLYEYA